MKKKRALFIHDHYFKYDSENNYYSPGGLPSSAWERYLLGFENIIVIGRDAGILKDNDIGRYTLSSRSHVTFNLFPNLSTFNNIIITNVIKRRIQELVQNADGIIVRLPSRLGRLFANEALKQGKPYGVEVVGCAWDSLYHYGSLRAKAVAPISYVLTKRAVKDASYVLYVTKDFLQKRYPTRTINQTYCSNVQIPALDEMILEKRLKHLSITDKGRIKLGLIGNYSANYKGIDLAIRALANLKSDGVNCELQVVGGGDPDRYLQLAHDCQVSNRVNFVGRLSSGFEIFNWLDQIDIYLQPSRVEGLPRALIEAMSRGLPAVAARVGGIPELLPEEYLFTKNNWKQLSNKLGLLLQNENKMIAEAKRNFIMANQYTDQVLSDKRKQFWKEYAESLNECQ